MTPRRTEKKSRRLVCSIEPSMLQEVFAYAADRLLRGEGASVAAAARELIVAGLKASRRIGATAATTDRG